LKIAFVWAFYYLKNAYSYSDALKDILLRGGDTDTNAAIVGGLLGAAYGVSAIDENQRQKMLSFDPKVHGGHMRPEFLVPKYGLVKMVEQVIQNCPTHLKVKWGDKILEDLQSIRTFFANELGKTFD
jgi:ADP-ribosyl-[dinitrogen reductase] hydrolase